MVALSRPRSNVAWVLFLVIGFSAVACAAAGCSRSGPAAGPISIGTAPKGASGDTLIEVRGLSGSELRSLDKANWDNQATWESLLHVSIGDNQPVAVAGRHVVTATTLEFVPSFPFDPGRTYTVRFDPAQLPTPRNETVVTAHVRLPVPNRGPATEVTAIFPSGDVWPENMLRFYVHFSAPMSRTQGVKFIQLVDSAGKEIPDAILAAYADLWNDDGTRLTVFFDPGRVKRGVGPNVAMGRAMVQGKRYAIRIDPAWPDGYGQPLASGFRREFTAGAAAYDAIDLKDWRISIPKAGSTDPLQVRFPAPLDHALLDRAIGVRKPGIQILAGRTATVDHEKSWTFTPATPWVADTYELAVLTLLEDPAGNKVGQPFEVLPNTPREPPPPEVATIPFQVK